MILFTGPSHAQLEQFADLVILTDSSGVGFKDSFVPLFCLINYMIHEIAEREKDNSLKVSSKIEDILNEGYFYRF
ncbi:hypothetical protein [Petroclostridium sp. X23]|uniref:hypothetical protein n=1 Tax=Petroclostridium sp. X23 TaxID=3045146 RepID=UPI0024AE5630|nr:hypothetical protein [Petroclostridium sp. X23]WHH58042.1 hypothetical protein QKW49_19870 [Petroclostridium sp. X23]